MFERQNEAGISREAFLKLVGISVAVGELALFQKGIVRATEYLHNDSFSSPESFYPVPTHDKKIEVSPLELIFSENKEYQKKMEAILKKERPFLYTVVDKSHPISEEEISHIVLPHLVHMSDVEKIKDEVIFVNPEKDRVHEYCVSDLSDLFKIIIPIDKTVKIRSSFRDFYEQRLVYKQSSPLYAVPAGTSQHHTGLAFDFTNAEVSNIVDVRTHFENTKSGQWLMDHSWEFGFVPSYINGHDGITFESWHFVYVGKEIGKLYHELKQEGWEGDIFDIQLFLAEKRISVGGNT